MRTRLVLAGLVAAAAGAAPLAPASAEPECGPYYDRPCFLVCEFLVDPYSDLARHVEGAPERC